MAVIKVACPKCGQKVSGDESFIGTEVECPICSSAIRFPGELSAFKGPVAHEPASEKVDEATSSIPVEHSQAKVYDDSSEVGHDVVQQKFDEEEENVPDDSTEDSSKPRKGKGDSRDSVEADDEEDDEETEPDGLPPSPIFGAISIVSAVLTVVSCFTLGILFAPVAIIAGHTALAKARHSPVQPAPGHTLGAIGLMIGYISLAVTILLLAVAAFFGEDIRDLLIKQE